MFIFRDGVSIYNMCWQGGAPLPPTPTKEIYAMGADPEVEEELLREMGRR